MLGLAGCHQPLPFPTPAQHDLVVLVAAGPLTHSRDDNGTANGLEHDLLEAFAQELGVGVMFKEVPANSLRDRLAAGDAHLAAGWLSTPPAGTADNQSTQALYLSHDVLIQHEASLPLEELGDLKGKTVHALPGSRQLQTLRRLQADIPGLRVVETDGRNLLELFEQVGERKISYLAVDSLLSDIGMQFQPNVQVTLHLGPDTPIVWWLGPNPNVELVTRLNQFIERVQRDGTLARIEDRYLGHVRRLTQADIIKFLAKTGTDLPRYRRHFQNAQVATGIDWRLLAAVAYHESNWDGAATSPTGVRGIMMLTEETADKLGVKNRLDPAESIEAGARYLNLLKSLLPERVPEPDRTWLALAAYNLGPGHFNAGRALARHLKADPDVWFEMKRILPLLAQPRYYKNLKTGRARGGEAVILVENIRSYYDILSRNAPPYEPPRANTAQKRGGLGLKARP